MRSIHILTIDNDAGLTSSAYTTEALADVALYEYVRDNWGTIYGLPPIPDNPNAAIRAYFDADNCDERAEIQEDAIDNDALLDEALAVANALREQIEQMRGMFKGDEAIAAALKDHDDLLAKITSNEASTT